MRWLLLLAVLAGCRKEPRQSQPVENRADAGATRPAPDAGDACVADCVKESQMRATSMEEIERECRATCAPDQRPSGP